MKEGGIPLLQLACDIPMDLLALTCCNLRGQTSMLRNHRKWVAANQCFLEYIRFEQACETSLVLLCCTASLAWRRETKKIQATSTPRKTYHPWTNNMKEKNEQGLKEQEEDKGG